MAKPKEEWRHLALFISILFLFLVTPLGAGVRQGALILNVIGATVLVAGSYALFERKRLFAVAVVLSVISITATWLLLVSQQHCAALLSHGCIILLIAFFSVTILATSCARGELPLTRSLLLFVFTCSSATPGRLPML
ncbi:MAG: hypothetical protein ABJB97_12535 [Acidobacteriota bacterium]